MIVQIFVIVVVLMLLYLLLKHWPETESATKQPGWSGALPAVLKGGSSESRLNRLGSSIAEWLSRAWQWLKGLFSDDKQRAAKHLLKSPRADEFSEFIGVKETRADRVGRSKAQPGPLSPIRASKTNSPLATKPTETWLGRLSKTSKPVAIEPTQTEAELLIARAETAKRNNNFTEAEKMLVKAAAKEPRNPRVYAKLGLLYLEQGENWKEAEESFQQALKFDAHNGFVRNNYGLVLYNQDRFTAAAKEFEAACHVDDSVASRHANLGLCYLSLRQYSKAEQEFKRAARLDAANSEYEDLLKEAAEKRRTHRTNI